MFRALLCLSSGGQIVLYSIWYRHTETSEWSKVTKIQVKNCKVIPLQARCGPEGGQRYSSTLQ